MSITIKEIAKLSGVSISTASLALNNDKRVSEPTKEKILGVARKYNYRPNITARGLAMKRTHNINAVVSGPSYKHYSSLVFLETLHGIAEVLNNTDYNLSINMTNQTKEIKDIQSLIDRKVCDGIIVIGSRASIDLVNSIKNNNTPIVYINRKFNLLKSEDNRFSVSINNKYGGYLATDYLIKKGHRKIVFIGDMPKVNTAEERLRGYYEALHDNNIKIDKNLVLYGDYYQESGYESMKSFIRYGYEATAVLAVSDLMAIGAMKAIYESGRRIPDDLSVMGFDGMPNTEMLKSSLTTVYVPFYDIGKKSADFIIDLINGREKERSLTIESISIIERDSVIQNT